MLISEISPIDKRGIDLSNYENIDDVINEVIELPLRKACIIFNKKGIRTLMSSANRNNVLQDGEKRIEKDDVYGHGQQYQKDRPTYEEAGKGYAWIMIDFDSLSDENKDWLFSLEESKGENGGKAIWFVHPCEIENIEYHIKVGSYDYEFLKTAMPEDKIPKGVKFDKRLAEFEKRHIVLAYNWAMYPLQTVFLRKPINENTTVEEVEEFFASFAEAFKSQVIEKKVEVPEER